MRLRRRIITTTLIRIRLPEDVERTHTNLNDQTLAGLKSTTDPMFSVQYHPEASPGPHDSHYLFSDFRKMMDEWTK